MISTILDSKQVNADVSREKRAERIKCIIMVLVGLVALSGLGVAAYHIYRTLSSQ